MDLTAFALVAVAAVLHAGWNLVAKRHAGDFGVFWVGLGLAAALLAPALPLLAGADAAGLLCVAATGLIHALYFAALAAAYRHGAISVVYPLARGSAVAGTALASAALLGERFPATALAGIAIVCAGIVGLGGSRLREAAAPGRAVALALLVGATTTGYSIVDKVGVGRVPPLGYAAGLALCTVACLAPYALTVHRARCAAAWRAARGASLLVGLGAMGTYLVILYAFRLAPAGYVVAVRELSIVVVAALGAAVLHERVTRPTGLSIAAIVVGVVLVKIS